MSQTSGDHDDHRQIISSNKAKTSGPHAGVREREWAKEIEKKVMGFFAVVSEK